MGLFGRKRKVIDLSEKYHEEQRAEERMKKNAEAKQTPSKYQNSISSDALNFFADKMNKDSQKEVSSNDDSDYSSEDKKKKLAKRLMEMTDRIEELSNQIYHLQQRIEVIEQRLKTKLNN